ncbi:hypothetical protein DVH24_003494 [Malus domestica]|uniref:Uncharacterized protein n=1 Tax=Malus domestica TaxID=3750 RepID=A0A498IHZ9_MALDO|nr:hypothetical protein DVH24_003494 [Malus domestica]
MPSPASKLLATTLRTGSPSTSLMVACSNELLCHVFCKNGNSSTELYIVAHNSSCLMLLLIIITINFSRLEITRDFSGNLKIPSWNHGLWPKPLHHIIYSKRQDSDSKVRNRTQIQASQN